jgi:hypothetical protein
VGYKIELASYIIGPSVIGVLTLILVLAMLAYKKIPLISGDRSAFIVLAVMNYVMCAVGPLPRTRPGKWLNPFNLVLYVIGVFAMLFIILVGTAETVPLPLVST